MNNLKFQGWIVMPYYLILTIIIIGCWSEIKAQNPSSDFKKMRSVFKDSKSLHLEIVYNFYPDSTSTTNIASEREIIKRTETQLYSSIRGVETIISNGNQVHVNHEGKNILVYDASKEADPRMVEFSELMYDSVLSFYKSIKYTRISETLASYDIYMDFAEYSSATIFFNPQNFHLKKIRLQTRMGEISENGEVSYPRVEILYEKIKTNVSFPASTFDIKKFIQIDHNKIIPSKKYEKYKVYNLKNQEG